MRRRRWGPKSKPRLSLLQVSLTPSSAWCKPAMYSRYWWTHPGEVEMGLVLSSDAVVGNLGSKGQYTIFIYIYMKKAQNKTSSKTMPVYVRLYKINVLISNALPGVTLLCPLWGLWCLVSSGWLCQWRRHPPPPTTRWETGRRAESTKTETCQHGDATASNQSSFLVFLCARAERQVEDCWRWRHSQEKKLEALRWCT